jgi:peroxiredoxin
MGKFSLFSFMATDGKMSEPSKKQRVTVFVILAVSLVAIVLVASRKFGRAGNAADSLLVPTAHRNPSAAVDSAPAPAVQQHARPSSAEQLSLATIAGGDSLPDSPDDETETGPPAEVDPQQPSRDAESDHEGEGAEGQEQDPDSSGDSTQKDPMKVLSRQFARRRAAREEVKQAERVTSVVPKVIHEPIVHLSEEHRKTCLVSVDDAMPDMQLAQGTETVSLKDALGETYTVVVFWSVTNPFAVEQFTRLESDVLQPFADARLKAVAIHVGEPQDVYAELCSKRGEDVTCLVDADKSSFARVATRKLPRTYLLDADGKIIWFDIEYSRSTRNELLNAVQYYLQGQQITPPGQPAEGDGNENSAAD